MFSKCNLRFKTLNIKHNHWVMLTEKFLSEAVSCCMF